MRPLHRSIGAAVLLLGAPLLAAAACGPPPPPTPPTGTTADPTATDAPTAPTSDPTGAPTGTASSVSSGCPSADPSCNPGPVFECRLPQPKKSDDTCRTDADCDVSEPCHAHACVAKSKAHPPDKSTICTRLMDCTSVDANPCGCFEGVCALVPRPR